MRLLVRLALAGIAISLALLGYHWLILGLLGWPTVVGLMALAAASSILVVIRKTGSIVFAAGCLAISAFAAIALLSILNGGFAFHVLIWGLLIPMAIPATWRRFFLATIAACIVLYVGLFALAILDAAPGAVIRHSQAGHLVIEALSLCCVLGLGVLISRATSGLTSSHVEERDRFQAALLQSQKLGSLGQLTDALVHDFNNVLMSMDCALHLLSKTINGSDVAWEEIEQLQSAMKRAKELSSQLEAFGSPGDGPRSSITIDESLAALETVARRLERSEVEVTFDLDSEDAKVEIEPSQIDQILVNLLVNAGDAIEGRGSITVSTRLAGDRVVIEVTDTGSGIAADTQEQLFEPFFTTKDADAGSGLGLWSSRQAARAAGGDLSVDSEVGRGTTMRVSLPVAGTIPRELGEAESTRASERRPTSLGQTIDAATDAIQRVRLLRWSVATIADPRARLWGVVTSALAMSGSFFWMAFASWYLFSLDAPRVAACMAVVGVLNGLMPLIVRWTRSVPLALTILAVFELAGLGVIVVARGGFPLPVLIFLLVIPLVANLQKEYPYLVPLSAALCVPYIAAFFALAVSGTGPTPSLLLSPTNQLIEGLMVLVASLTLFSFAMRVSHSVDMTLSAERDQFRGALLRSREVETVGTFASSIAHDLNNVLMTLEFSIALLERALSVDHPGRVDIDQLRAACTRIRSLSRQLIRFGRDDDGAPADVDIDSALLDLESLVRPLLGRHIKLEYGLSASAARVSMRSKRFDQIILNLLLNARDAMPDGGVLTVTTRADDSEVTIDVADGGDGVCEEIQPRIFDPFFTTGARSGLGLWLCKGITEEIGGRLSMAATSQTGTTMRLRLPRTHRRGLLSRPGEMLHRRREPDPGSLRP